MTMATGAQPVSCGSPYWSLADKNATSFPSARIPTIRPSRPRQLQVVDLLRQRLEAGLGKSPAAFW